MTDRLVAGATGAHRFVFIFGTALLAVGTSQLADARGTLASWLLTIGGAALMFCGDQLQDVERTSVELSRTAQRPIAETRVDIFGTRRPVATWILLLGGLALAIIGLIL